ncbi:DUF5683 domain-containing protein [Hymenobacter sp. HDW8]|uniref:DUF5683 domain-containing protein n=1 Tax=Hymenobacter sp. HDW8 TaxID=2714932 RepID=UPI0014091325|nr:DUF5683 domain-containing protein [Hymenobacter sp. HDW8]QIL75591.1 hypothetical protein G7064_06825 [Hymenobacter sp. HDW8]
MGAPLAQSAQAQVVTTGPDSTRVSTPAVADTTRRTERLFGLHLTRPAKAAMLSALVPGAGQIYNRKYWKLPIVYGVLGTALTVEFFYQSRFKEFREAKIARNDNDPLTIDTGPLSSTIEDNATIDRGLIIYRRNRDKWIAFSAVAYAIGVVDALVDAHLRDFDVSDDLSLRWEPTMLYMPTAQPTAGVNLSLNLKSTSRSTK